MKRLSVWGGEEGTTPLRKGRPGTASRGRRCFNVIFFFLNPELSMMTYFSRGKEKQARFFGSLNATLPWPRQFCQSNKRA